MQQAVHSTLVGGSIRQMLHHSDLSPSVNLSTVVLLSFEKLKELASGAEWIIMTPDPLRSNVWVMLGST